MDALSLQFAIHLPTVKLFHKFVPRLFPVMGRWDAPSTCS